MWVVSLLIQAFMIQKSISLAAMTALLTGVAPVGAQTEVATAPIAVAPTQVEMVEAFGYFSAFQLGIKQLGFEASDSEAILKGFAAALKDEDNILAVVQSPAFKHSFKPDGDRSGRC